MWLILRFESVSQDGAGVRYYKFSIFWVSVDIIPSPSGILGRWCKWIDRLFPDPEILEYLPLSFSAGTIFAKAYPLTGDYTLPEDVFLLGAECFGGFGSEALDLWLFGGASATYTQYPPNEQGITFLPDFPFPAPASWFETELPYGGGFFTPPETPSSSYINIASRNNGTQYTPPYKSYYWSNLLWAYSGAFYAEGHLVSHLEEFEPIASNPLQGVKMRRTDNPTSIFIQPGGSAGEGLTTQWVHTSAYGDEWNLLIYRFPTNPVYIPGDSGTPKKNGNTLVSGVALALGSILGIIPGSGLFAGFGQFFGQFNLSPNAYEEEFLVDGEPLAVDGSAMGIQ